MGINENRFLAIHQDFKCQLCNDIILEPTQVNSDCEHLFCLLCISNYTSNGNYKCPIDNQSIAVPLFRKPSKYWSNQYNSLRIKCNFDNNGCQAITTLQDLYSHEINCKFNPNSRIDCPKACGAVIRRKDLSEHNCVSHLRGTIDEKNSDIAKLREEIENIKSLMNKNNNTLNEYKEQVAIKFDNMSIQVNSSSNRITELQRNPVPNGFIYIQMPHQTSPQKIWPNTVWNDISSNFSGLFFRVIGGESAAFGLVQEENIPNINKVEVNKINPDFYNNGQCYYSSNIGNGGSSNWLPTGGYDGNWCSIKLHKSGGEVRPKNMSIRVWKKVN